MSKRDQNTYAILLIGSALLSLLAAAHHGTVRAHDAAGLIRGLSQMAGAISAVHAALIALFVAELIGLYGFARLLGLARPLPAAGLILVAIGGAAMVAAGAINGFALPAFATAFRDTAPAGAEGAAMILRLCWELNQAFATIGTVAWGAGLCAWSLDLASRRGLVRATGFAGLAASLAIVAGIATGLIRLHVGGFIAVTTLLTCWSVAAGALMLSGRLTDEEVVPGPD
jgi:hypothetical protein